MDRNSLFFTGILSMVDCHVYQYHMYYVYGHIVHECVHGTIGLVLSSTVDRNFSLSIQMVLWVPDQGTQSTVHKFLIFCRISVFGGLSCMGKYRNSVFSHRISNFVYGTIGLVVHSTVTNSKLSVCWFDLSSTQVLISILIISVFVYCYTMYKNQ